MLAAGFASDRGLGHAWPGGLNVRVVLIRPICRTGSYDPDVQEPFGLQVLAGSLRATGHGVQLLDLMGADHSEALVVRKATAFQPDLVGFCLSSVNEMDSIAFLIQELAAVCKAKVPLFVIGGFLVSTEPEFVAQNFPEGTVLVRYEGELALLTLAETETAAWPAAGLSGGLLIGPGHSLVKGLPPKMVEPLDCLPMAARDLTKHYVKRDHAVLIQGSRGCFGYCTYCCMPLFPRPATCSWRGRSPENIADEMAAVLKDFGPCAIDFVDEDFLGSPVNAEKRAEKLSKEIEARQISTAFSIQATPIALTRSVIEPLARAGLARIFLSVENDDPMVLRKWGKPLTLPGAWDTVATLREFQVDVRASTILFHPDCTLMAVKRFAEKLHQHRLLTYETATSHLVLLPGSVMYEQAKRTGQLKGDCHGEFVPEIRDKLADDFYRTLLTALSPLQPAWMHASRKLSTMMAWEKAKPGKAAKDAPRQESLRGIISDLNDAVSKTFFGLLSDVERGFSMRDDMVRFQKENFRIVDRDIGFLLKPNT